MAISRDIKYLVFSGGGAAGFAYSGAIEQLGKTPGFSFDAIEGVAGTSVGAIIALCLSLGYSPQELSKKMDSMDFTRLEDGGSLPSELYQLYSKLGWYKGEALYDFIKELIREKTGREDPENVTFADLQALGLKDLRVVATKMRMINDNAVGKTKVFSYETTPDTSVAAAVRASASTPFYFSRVRMKKIAKGHYVLTDDEKGQVYCDGGLSDNFPIGLFDKRKFIDATSEHGEDHAINPHTLGLALRQTDQIVDASHKPNKRPLADNQPLEMIEGILHTIASNFIYEGLMKAENRERTVQIDRLGVSLGQFDLSSETRNALKKSAKIAVKQHFPPAPTEQADEFVSHKAAIGMWDKNMVVNSKEEKTKHKQCVMM